MHEQERDIGRDAVGDHDPCRRQSGCVLYAAAASECSLSVMFPPLASLPVPSSSFLLPFTSTNPPTPDSPPSSSSRIIDLDVDVGADAVDYNAIANQESLSGLETEMRKLEGLVKEIVDEMGYLKKREARVTVTNGEFPFCRPLPSANAHLSPQPRRTRALRTLRGSRLCRLRGWGVADYAFDSVLQDELSY